jgi:hypothetical protein
MRKFIFYISLLVFSTHALANTGLEDNNHPELYSWRVEFEWANDFVFQTDYYFTNGMSLKVWHNGFKASPLNYVLIPHSENRHVVYGVSLVQDIFTPTNTGMASPQVGDRPYASYWLAGSVKQSYNIDYSLGISSGLYFGMSGTQGGGELVQNGIHDLLPTSAHVNGWNNQLGSSFLVDYYLNVEKQFYRNSFFKVSGSVGGMVGTPYTNLDGGIQLYVGEFGRYPGLSFMDEHSEFHIYGFSKLNTKWVIHNASLEGSLFDKNNSSLALTPNPFVLQMQNGISVKYRGFNIEIGQKLITPEFSGAKTHKWGYVGFSLSF